MMMRENLDHIRNVENSWKEHWNQSDMRPDNSWRGQVLRKYVSKLGGFSSSRHILKTFLKHVGDVQGLSILDAGSGTGLNSLPLSYRGAQVTLLDIAPQALQIAEVYFQEQNLKANMILGSIFEMP